MSHLQMGHEVHLYCPDSTLRIRTPYNPICRLTSPSLPPLLCTPVFFSLSSFLLFCLVLYFTPLYFTLLFCLVLYFIPLYFTLLYSLSPYTIYSITSFTPLHTLLPLICSTLCTLTSIHSSSCPPLTILPPPICYTQSPHTSINV